MKKIHELKITENFKTLIEINNTNKTQYFIGIHYNY
jgi:hypothetical protein